MSVTFYPLCFLPSNSRIMGEIKQNLKMEAKTSQIRYNEGKIEGHEIEIKRILSTLGARSPSSLKISMSMGGCPTYLAPVHPHSTPPSPISH